MKRWPSIDWGTWQSSFSLSLFFAPGLYDQRVNHALVGDHVLGHLGEIRERRVRLLLARASRPGHLHHHFLNIEGVIRCGLAVRSG
jgi:hypothetical protein